MKVSVIIPSLNPDHKLVEVVEALIAEGFDDIILVNDGSDEAHMAPFHQVEVHEQCTLLTHEVNRGKGRALKTAFEYCSKNRQDIAGVVTVDGDNQHRAKDIRHCAEVMIARGNKVILGARNFSGPEVPFKSKFGNQMTSFVFKFACGLNISDTQTGLRAIPKEYLDLFAGIKGERFEYETDMLLELRQSNIAFEEVEIETVYIDDNASTHFHPIRDSIKIYGVILKFMMGSLMSSVIDLAAFAVLQMILLCFVTQSKAIFCATVFARMISSLFNYTFNRKAVFQSGASVQKSLVKYYVLCVCQMLVSYGLVWGVTALLTLGSAWTVVAKAVIDTILFVISFQIQRRWVFAKENKS